MSDAQTILQSLECSRPSCECHASLGKGRGRTHCPCPHHRDSNPSLNVTTGNNGKVLVKCFGGCDQDAVFEALADRGLWRNLAPRTRHARRAPKPKGKREPIHWNKWKLRKADGTHVATKVRTDFNDGTKTYFWEDTLDGFSSKTAPLYGVERLNGAASGILNEGEKATDALLTLEIPAVGTVTGSSTLPSDETLQPLLDLEPVFLWPDAAVDGQKHMDAIGERLQALGHPDIRVIDWEDAAPKGDAADFVAAGNDADAVRELCKSAERWEPHRTPTPTIDAHHSEMANNGKSGNQWTPETILLSDVEPEHVAWLWFGRVAFGKLTIFDGDPGVGKSTASLDLAARITKHRAMPDEQFAPLPEAANVMLLTVEDGLADTIRPRLDAAGADSNRVVALTRLFGANPDDERLYEIPTDVPIIEQLVEKHEAQLLIIDPLVAFLSADVNVNRDQDVRRALAPLVRMAERRGLAIIAIRHLNKSAAQHALYRGGGSIGIIGAARSGLLFAIDPDDETERRRIVAPNKGNLSAKAPALIYTLDAKPNQAVRVKWQGQSNHNARQLLATIADDEQRDAIAEAKQFLEMALGKGKRLATEIQQQSRNHGIAGRTLHRAKKTLRIESEREGFGADGKFYWKLPESSIDCQSNGMATYDDTTDETTPDNPDKSGQNEDAAIDCHPIGCQPSKNSLATYGEGECQKCGTRLLDGEVELCRACANPDESFTKLS